MKKATLSRIKGIMIWWAVFFILSAIVILLVSLFKNCLFLILPAIPFSLVFSIIIYFISLKRYRERLSHNFEAFKEMLAQKGPCPECIDELNIMLKQKQSPANKNTIYTSMAEIYLEMDEAQKASDAVDKIDISQYLKNDDEASRMRTTGYCRISLLRYIALNDKENCIKEYENSKEYFDEFISKKPYDIILKLMMVSYYRVIENYKEGLALLKTIDAKGNAEIQRLIDTENALYLIKTGKPEKAEKLLNELIAKAKNKYTKKALENELEKLKSVN